MALRELLRPWYRRLRPASTGKLKNGTLWFSLGCHALREDAVVATLEGLQLLMRLRRASPGALDAVVNELWPNTFGADAVRQVAVSLDASTANGYTAVSACFLKPTGKRRPSPRYLDALLSNQQALQSSDGEYDESSEPPDILFHVFLGGATATFKRTLRCLVDYVKIGDADGSAETHRPFKLRISKVDFSRSEYYVVDMTRFIQLQELVTRGVAITNCRQPDVRDVPTAASARECFVGVQVLLQTAGRDRRGANDPTPGLQSAMLDPRYLVNAPRVCSAIASSGSLRKVWIGVGIQGDVPHQTMHWAGVALCGITRHNLKRVEFDIERLDVLQGVLDVFAAADPLAVVFERHATSIQSHQHLRASASRFALLEPTAGGAAEGGDVVETHEHKELRVITHDGNWWSTSPSLGPSVGSG